MRFLHLSDVHIGYQQYGLRERFNDFGVAFEQAIVYGIKEKVDAVLIAGDLFHKSSVEPGAYLQAINTLRATRISEIPVFVIEGNHDQARYRDQVSWLDILNADGYIHLLRTEFPQNEPCALNPWDQETQKGAYIDIQNVRIIGLQWLGAAMSSLFPDFVSQLSELPPTVNFTVLLTHAALEGEVAKVPIYLDNNHLQSLKDWVQYLALGHLHKPFEKNDWAYNPGSLEVYDLSEIAWSKGWYDVMVFPDGSKKIKRIESTHRPFYSEVFQVDSYPEVASLYRGVLDTVRKRARAWTKHKELAVIEFKLKGRLSFDRLDLDLKRIEDIIREEATVCHVVINSSRLDSPGFETKEEASRSTEEVELSVLRQLVESDSRFSSQADYWAKNILMIKEMVLTGYPPEEILGTLQAQVELAKGEKHDH